MRHAAFFALFLVVACKRTPAPEQEPAATKPSAEPAAPKKPKPRPVVATALSAVRCNLTDKPRDGSNSVAATRHLHRGPKDELYFFPDFLAPTLLEPISEGADGCGYRSKGAMPEKPQHDFALMPDGSITLVPNSDDTKATACGRKAFSALRYGDGRLVGKVFTYHGSGALMRMKLDDPKCEPEEVKSLPPIPDSLPLEKARVAVAGDDLLLGVPREDWKWSRELFRFDTSGKLVRKYGAADGKGEVRGEVTGCGDGLCSWAYQTDLEVYDREGQRVNTLSVPKVTGLERVFIAGAVDVPSKGVFVLVGHHPVPKGDGRAELIRIDGVYDK